jgi:hypothetical protein
MVTLIASSASAADAPRTTIRPQDTGLACAGPGMGWVFHFYDNSPTNYGSKLEPSDTVDEFPGLTVVYLRIPWSYIEPEEGRFNWAVVDGPAQRWIAKGKKVAFRFTCSESWTRYATPEWVQKAGAKGHNFEPGKGVKDDGPYWEPDYNDPIFLDKLDHFLAAAAARYDGNPEVAFYDMGSFGVWGEGHTYSSTLLPYDAATIRRHIDLHLKHFKHTLLAANDDLASQDRGIEVINYARDHGLTLRDDSILVQGGKNAYFSAGMAPGFWEKLPVILESEHYGGSRDRGNWGDGHLYLQAVEDYHASYVSIHWWPREFLAEQRGLIDRMNRRLGYRLQLVEASWPTQLREQAAFQVNMQWRNAGVAPCYPGGCPALTLKDAKGGIAGVFVDESFDMRTLPVGPPDKAEIRKQSTSFALPFNLKPGAYEVLVSVGTRTGTPQVPLPLAGSDGQMRYRIGTLRVSGDYDVRIGELAQKDGKWVLPATWMVEMPLPQGASPFCHFERDGTLEFQGQPEPGAPVGDLSKVGTVTLPFEFTVPDGARGNTYEVKVGLWVPERIAQPDERLIPSHGDIDRRVTVGTLKVGADGAATFEPAAK